LVDKGTDQIIGAHLLGPNAEEIINLFTLARSSSFLFLKDTLSIFIF
jgi:pyruvate/2-oxoglutarate dehydrogenase complex dihydrolipoamide dehydrogenase (E3) component